MRIRLLKGYEAFMPGTYLQMYDDMALVLIKEGKAVEAKPNPPVTETKKKK